MPRSKDLTINGTTKTVSAWAKQIGVPTRVIRERQELGWSGDDLLKPTRALAFHGAASGGKRTPELVSYTQMRQRCLNRNCKDYADYGAVGITICDRWLHGEGSKSGFECFLDDMGTRPAANTSIDRIDGKKGYSPDNCRWASPRDQVINRKATRLVRHEGVVRTVTDWARHYGISQPLLHGRLERGWKFEDAIKPAREYKYK
jgi:hypothetical protein